MIEEYHMRSNADHNILIIWLVKSSVINGIIVGRQ